MYVETEGGGLVSSLKYVPVRNGPDCQRRNHVTCHVHRLRHRHHTLLLTHQVKLGERTQKEGLELNVRSVRASLLFLAFLTSVTMVEEPSGAS